MHNNCKFSNNTVSNSNIQTSDCTNYGFFHTFQHMTSFMISTLNNYRNRFVTQYILTFTKNEHSIDKITLYLQDINYFFFCLQWEGPLAHSDLKWIVPFGSWSSSIPTIFSLQFNKTLETVCISIFTKWLYKFSFHCQSTSFYSNSIAYEISSLLFISSTVTPAKLITCD